MQNKFGLAYWYYLSFVSKNIIKVYKEVVGDFICFIQIYLCLLCVDFFLLIFFEKNPWFSTFVVKIYFGQNI